MKIEKRGIRITEVPGVDYIESEPLGVAIKFTAVADPLRFGMAELSILRDALNAALDETPDDIWDEA